ncbi:tRNA lysidine(34) synthetase TilS [Microbacteriaceae bacterium 4G12]
MTDSFVQKVDSFVAQYNLLRSHTTVVIAVSGGSDSLALLHYFLERKKQDALQLIVAHVDHMFRGEESKQDLIYVKQLCEQLDVICEAKQIDVTAYQKEHQLSAQVAARECRYAYLKTIMKKYGADYLALGHHGDDQIETILMRLVRGSTPKGYAGILAKRSFGQGEMIRPLLAVTKEEIESYCERKKIIPRIDPTNKKETYTRNRFRKHVLPCLKKENPHVHERFQAFSRFIQEDEDYLQELAFQKMNKVIKKQDKNNISMSIPAFQSLPMPLQRRGIQLILNYLYEYRLPSSLSSIHIEQVLAFLKRTHPSGSLDFPEGLKVIRTYEECCFGFLEDKNLPFSYTLQIPGKVILPNGDEITACISKGFPEVYNSSVFVGLYDAFSMPLTVRSRKEGDRITIKGMNGTKKIKAIFIEEKVPKINREEWPVVCDAEGNIVWLPLLRRCASAISPKEANESSYILIHYRSKESSRRIIK